MITPLTPQLTIEWFERMDMQYEALCIFLTANPVHRDIIREFNRNRIDADAGLGSRMGFIVSDSEFSASQEIATNRGRRFILPGEVVRPLSPGSILQSASEGDLWRGLGNDSFDKDRCSDVTAKSNLEWIDFFSIQKVQLPVLCVLVKGCDPISICLTEDISLPKLLRLLGEISDIADCDSRTGLLAISDFNKKFARFSELTGRLAEKEKELVELFKTLAEISKANDRDKEKIADYIFSKRYSPDELMQLLKGLDFYISPEFKHRKTITGLMNKSRAIEGILAEMDEQILSDRECESISEAVDRISERRNKSLIFIKGMAKDQYHTSSVGRSRIARRHDPYSIRVDSVLNGSDKIAMLLSKYKGSNLLFAKLMSFAGSRTMP